MYDKASELLGPVVIAATDDECAIAQAEDRAKAVNAGLREVMRLLKRISHNTWRTHMREHASRRDAETKAATPTSSSPPTTLRGRSGGRPPSSPELI
jgi:hypothetical protein